MPERAAQQESHVTSEQLIRVASRLFVAYLLFWVVSDLTVIAREFLSVVHYVREGDNAGLSAFSIFKTSYLARYYILDLAENVLRIALWLMAAGWLSLRTTHRIVLYGSGTIAGIHVVPRELAG